MVQVLSRAAELLGLVPVFPVKNVSSFSSGASGSNAVFRDCILVKKNSTVADAAKKIIGDAPLAYVEGIGGVRVSEDDLVAIGKNDVSFDHSFFYALSLTMQDPLFQSRSSIMQIGYGILALIRT